LEGIHQGGRSNRRDSGMRLISWIRSLFQNGETREIQWKLEADIQNIQKYINEENYMKRQFLIIAALIVICSLPAISQNRHTDALEGRVTTTWVHRTFSQFTYNVYAVHDTTGADTLWFAPTSDDTGRGHRIPLLQGESQLMNVSTKDVWLKASGNWIRYRVGGTH